jgi:hypothetical protein
MSILKDLVKQIEDHTGMKFDFNNRRHFGYLSSKIERLHNDDLRKLNLIQKVIDSKEGEDDLFSSSTHYLQKRFKE